MGDVRFDKNGNPKVSSAKRYTPAPAGPSKAELERRRKERAVKALQRKRQKERERLAAAARAKKIDEQETKRRTNTAPSVDRGIMGIKRGYTRDYVGFDANGTKNSRVIDVALPKRQPYSKLVNASYDKGSSTVFDHVSPLGRTQSSREPIKTKNAPPTKFRPPWK